MRTMSFLFHQYVGHLDWGRAFQRRVDRAADAVFGGEELGLFHRRTIEIDGDAEGTQARVDIKAGDATRIPGDANLLTIVFQNLLLNAAQAMQGRGRIDVTLSADGDWQRIAVADQGPGIPAEIKAALFRPFKTTKARGTGLGMATAKRLVELHGGRISVDCPAQGGTIITILLPLSRTTTASRG